MKDKKDWKFIGFFAYTGVFWLLIIVGMGFMIHHNFWKNTPERYADPINWMWGGFVIVGYIIHRYWGNKT